MTPPSTSTDAPTEAASESATSFSIDSLTLPEGAVLDDADKTALTELATKFNLSGEAMNALAEYHYSKLGATAETLNAQVSDAWTETSGKWQKEIWDAYGGEEATAKLAREKFGPLIDKFGGDPLREALAVTGAGNHPVLFDFFLKIADALGEGTPVVTNAAPKASDPFQSIYKNSPSLFGAKQ